MEKETRPEKENLLLKNLKKSGLYSAFVRFGRHIKSINPVGSTEQFIDYLLKKNIGIDSWCQDEIYYEYVRELTKNEHPIDALSRTFVLMEKWANDANKNPSDFFKEISPSQAVLWIISGRISPLIL